MTGAIARLTLPSRREPPAASPAHHAEDAKNVSTTLPARARLIAAAAKTTVVRAASSAFHSSGAVSAGTGDSYASAGETALLRNDVATLRPPLVGVRLPATELTRATAHPAATISRQNTTVLLVRARGNDGKERASARVTCHLHEARTSRGGTAIRI